MSLERVRIQRWEPPMERRGFLQASVGVAGVLAMDGMLNGQESKAELANSATAKRVKGKAKLDLSRGCPPEIRAALSGPWPSIRTPFKQDGQIDFDSLYGLLNFLIEQAKVKAVVLTWGDSLFSLLTDEDIAQVTKAVVQHVDRRVFVVAATGQWWTGKSVEFAKYCVDIGADMLMTLPPDWAGSTTHDSLVTHFRAVGEQIPVMVVTNFLIARGIDFGIELMRRLRNEVPAVIALKDDFLGEFIRKTCLLTHDRWALSAGGAKQNHLNMLPFGADGYLSTFINFRPDIAWSYWNAVSKGDIPNATRVIRDYDLPLFDYMRKSEGGFDAVMHGIYEAFGLTKRWRRVPYHSLSDKQMESLTEFLRQTKILS